MRYTAVVQAIRSAYPRGQRRSKGGMLAWADDYWSYDEEAWCLYDVHILCA